MKQCSVSVTLHLPPLQHTLVKAAAGERQVSYSQVQGPKVSASSTHFPESESIITHAWLLG